MTDTIHTGCLTEYFDNTPNGSSNGCTGARAKIDERPEPIAQTTGQWAPAGASATRQGQRRTSALVDAEPRQHPVGTFPSFFKERCFFMSTPLAVVAHNRDIMTAAIDHKAQVAHNRAIIAGRHHLPDDDPQKVEARRNLRHAKLFAVVEKALKDSPPLTTEQRHAIAALLLAAREQKDGVE